MRALVLGAHGPALEERPEPDPAGEAVIRLRLGGVCATDLELIKGYMGFAGVLGHEWVGEVVDCPDPAWVGRRVVGGINCACGACATCRRGWPTHCPDRTVLGIQGRDGAFAERFRLPTANLLPVPDRVPDEAAVFVEPLAAAIETLEQVHVRPTDRVVVLGVGRLGQLCARVLALTGADVHAVGRRPEPLALLPAPIRGVLAEAVDALRGADLVVDTTGSPDGLALASSLVRPRGTIVLKTTTHDLGRAAPTGWVIDEVTLVGSRCGPFAPALRLLETGHIDPSPLITGRCPLGQGVEALEAARRPEHVKVVIEG